MLNMGLPKDAVKNALSRDGKDPSIMDLNPDQVGAKESLRTLSCYFDRVSPRSSTIAFVLLVLAVG